jgi:N-acetylmuramoyl-L-alanine amidase
MRPLNRIILHSTATPEGRDVTVEEIRNWHLDRGWDDIGYHYVIYRNGAIKLGRPLSEQGAHTLGHNEDSIGVVYVGGTDISGNAKDTRTLQQRISMRLLIAYLKAKHGINQVLGHGQCTHTECPSFDVDELNRQSKYDIYIAYAIIGAVVYWALKRI